MEGDVVPSEKFKGMGLCSTLTLFIRHSCQELCRRLCYFVISFLSCFLAITVALVANTVIANGPLLFLRMSELNQAEIDLTLTPAADTSSYPRFLNATKMEGLTGGSPMLTPRLTFGDTKLFVNVDRERNVTLLVLDSAREKQLGIGRNYNSKPLQQNECAIHKNLVAYLGLQADKSLNVEIPMSNYMALLMALQDPVAYAKLYPAPSLPSFPAFRMTCTVSTIFSSLEGKVPSGSDDGYIYMEYKWFLKSLAASASLDAKLKSYLQTLNPYDVAISVLTNHPNRLAVYTDSDFERVQKVMTGFTSELLDKLGFFAVSTSLPILVDLQSLSMAAVFLGIILNLVVILLAAISSYLVYSLLMISFETRTFEIGLYRLMGLTKLGISGLVIIQSLLFVLPALVFGIGSSFLILYLVSNMFEGSLGVTFSPVPNATAFGWAFGVGFAVPLVASLLPIKVILEKTLNACLDMAHSKIQGVHITIELAEARINWGMVAFGLVAISFGFSIYYLLPLSLLSMNFQLMLWLMLSILLALIIGFIILSLNIQYIIETTIVYLLLFLETAHMKMLLLKNMVAHKFRNRRTGIIYSLALGFLLFVVVGYSMELRNSQLTMLSTHGGFLEFAARKNQQLTFDIVLKVEETLAPYANIIEGYTWWTPKLALNPHMKMKENWLGDYGRLYKYQVDLYTASPKYFDVTSKMFLDVFDSNKSSGLSLGEQLYTPRGSQALATGSFIESELGLSTTDMGSTLLLIFDRLAVDVVYETRAQFLLNSCPGFRMSRLLRSYQVALISYPLFMQFVNATSFSTLLYEGLIIKVRDDSESHYETLYSALSALVAMEQMPANVWSYSNQAGGIESIKSFLDILFNIIIVLFMILCVFSLVSSMTANVMEQSKELAVMRAIGMTKCRTVILYMYEAFLIVLSSSLIGSLIGMIIGYTLSLQRKLYTDLPVTFEFPWTQLLVIFISSIFCAALSSITPANIILGRSVGELAKL